MSETVVELARILGKLEAGKELSAKELLMILPYVIVQDVEAMLKEFKEQGKIKPRRRLFR